MPIGIYEEPLPCGGKLYVNGASWGIHYYFGGPDLRYNGTFFSVAGTNIEPFIAALEANWLESQNLKDQLPSGGVLMKPGRMGMTIQIGPSTAVYLYGQHKPITSQAAVDRIVASYRYAAERAPKLQAMLNSLS